MSSATLRKALNRNSAEPDANGLFTTRQIAGAAYGRALSEEKLRTQRQIARKLELENAVTTASVLNRAEMMRALALISDAMTSRILAANIDRAVKEDLLQNLGSLPLVLQDVAHAQSRLLRGNGKMT
jgi:hypothetical protein